MTTIALNPTENRNVNLHSANQKHVSAARKFWNALKESYMEYAMMVYEPQYYAYSRMNKNK
ncbi:MAG: hypothetical protein PUE58_04970 [Lachnospiraceae bacterium]|nr:hypothetical protein [Lachnospiraceae bacterium]